MSEAATRTDLELAHRLASELGRELKAIIAHLGPVANGNDSYRGRRGDEDFDAADVIAEHANGILRRCEPAREQIRRCEDALLGANLKLTPSDSRPGLSLGGAHYGSATAALVGAAIGTALKVRVFSEDGDQPVEVSLDRLVDAAGLREHLSDAASYITSQPEWLAVAGVDRLLLAAKQEKAVACESMANGQHVPAPIVAEDGPFGADGWRHDGEEFRGLTPKPWLFAKLLYDRLGQSVPLDDFAEPVHGDREGTVTADMLNSWRREANKFFKKHSIPLTISTVSRSRFAVMKRT